MIIFELTLNRKCVKLYKQFKYYHEMCLKRQYYLLITILFYRLNYVSDLEKFGNILVEFTQFLWSIESSNFQNFSIFQL